MYSKYHSAFIKAFIFLCLINTYIMGNSSLAMKTTFLDNHTENNITVEIKTTSPALYDKKISEIIVEPTKDDFIYRSIPSNFYIPKGVYAYKVSAKDSAGSLICDTKLKYRFTLQIGYPKHITPEEAINLRVFMLSNKKTWVPLPSRIDTFRRFIKTENAHQLGIYSLFAPLSYKPDVLVYPNPVQFGRFGGVNKTLKFRNVPLGSVIEIFTIR